MPPLFNGPLEILIFIFLYMEFDFSVDKDKALCFCNLHSLMQYRIYFQKSQFSQITAFVITFLFVGLIAITFLQYCLSVHLPNFRFAAYKSSFLPFQTPGIPHFTICLHTNLKFVWTKSHFPLLYYKLFPAI